MNPFKPGKPSEENMATLIQPQSNGAHCISPPKSFEAARAAPLFEQTDEVEQRRRGNSVIEDLHEDTAQGGLHVDRRTAVDRANREKAQHAVAEMIDRKVGHHPFQIGLGPCGQRSEKRSSRRQARGATDRGY